MNNLYIVNSAIYNNTIYPETVDEEARKVIQKSLEIAASGREIIVVLGINAPERTDQFPKTATDEEMMLATERVNALAASLIAGKPNIQVRVVQYRWNRFDDRLRSDVTFAANERINYLAIRNNLFYSNENICAIAETIEKAQTMNQSSVKLIALDGDSDISLEQLEQLEKTWAKEFKVGEDSVRLPPLITTGYYKFMFSEEDKLLHEIGGEYNWGRFLAFIENKIDRKSKEELGTSQFNGKLLYRRFNLPKNRDEIDSKYILQRKQKLQKNLFVLEKNQANLRDSFKEDSAIDRLKVNICDVLSMLDAYKISVNEDSRENRIARAVLHESIVERLYEIEKLESGLEHLDELQYDIKMSGKEVIYPSENVMFISLYDKGMRREYNIFSEIIESQGDEAVKQRKLWGDGVGREEGENVVSQMRKFWNQCRENRNPALVNLSSKSEPTDDEMREAIVKKTEQKVSQHFEYERDLVSFLYTFETALPPRAHKFLTSYQKRLAEIFPKTKEELLAIVQDEKKFDQLVENCVKLIASRSQTSLSEKFLKQRLRYIRGVPSDNSDFSAPDKKLSYLNKIIREATADAFTGYFKEFQNSKIEDLKSHIKMGILRSLTPQDA